jgi:HEAT repeat protein
MLRIRCFPLLLLAIAASGPLHAQLDLPGAKRGSSGGTPPPPGSGGCRGLELPSGGRGDLAPGSENQGQLDLPGRRPGNTENSGEPESSSGAPPPLPATLPEGDLDPSREGAAALIYERLAASRDPRSSLVSEALASLAVLGEAALVGARVRLPGDHAPLLLVSGRLLLDHGTPEDRRAVARRLEQRLPGSVAGPLLGTLLERDPQVASPSYLVGLLGHSSGAMRSAAERALEPRVQVSHLPLLAKALRADRADTRLRGLALLSRLEDPAVLSMLLSRIGDESAKVAFRAASKLASLEDDRVAEALLTRAFAGSSLDRGAAYALLAIIGREDRVAESVLLDEHIPALRGSLNSGEEIVVGAAAAALAGIGFRSESSRGMEWLDLEVPHQLIRLAAGSLFHRDYTSLQGIALRRLSLITGQSFGDDHFAWRKWWSENAVDFHARRAVIEVQPGDETTLEIRYRTGYRPSDACLLVGPAAGAIEGVFLGSRYFLTERECGEVVEILRREGVFGVERTPDRLVGALAHERVFEVTIAGQKKGFLLSDGVALPWLERLINVTLAVAERNRWQLFRDRGRHPDQHSLWREEKDDWLSERTPLERDRRFLSHLLSTMNSVAVAERDPAIEEMVALLEKEGHARSEDFPAFVGFLSQERFLGPRANSLLECALVSAVAPHSEGKTAEGDTAEGEITGTSETVLARGRSLVEVLVESIGETSFPAITRTLEFFGEDLSRWAAADARPLVRSASAAALAAGGEVTPLSREILIGLLADPDPQVEATAVIVLGRSRVEEARGAILLRARRASPLVRAAALIAAGRLGGPEVREVLELAIFDSDGRVQAAAAEGFAELADPGTAGLLVRLFSQGSESALFDPARRGLRRIGSAAWDDLLRVSASGADASRRDASLLLAEQGVPEATSSLIRVLTSNPRDARVAGELAVLTCIDFRREEDPAAAWWGWWDLVVHDDSLLWLCAAAEREEIEAPAPSELAGAGSRSGARFLLEVMRHASDPLSERSRRELSRMLEGTIGDPPPRGRLRDEWLEDLDTAIAEHFVGAPEPTEPTEPTEPSAPTDSGEPAGSVGEIR